MSKTKRWPQSRGPQTTRLRGMVVFAANLLTRLGGTTNYSHYVAECGLLLSPFGHPGHDIRAILTGVSWG